MSSPITSIQGLSSGIQWQDLIDQLIAAETAQQLTPVQTAAAKDGKALAAWNSYGSALGALGTAAQSLQDGSAFDSLTVSGGTSPTTGRGLLSATANSAAVPGSYGVQVVSLASAQQLSGNIVSDPTVAQGISGQIIVAGQTLTLAGTDSLNAIRDKINALNTGQTPTHISASVLYSGTGGRLVLTSDVGGSSGLDLRDARASSNSPSVLTQLGFINGKTTNIASDGAARSAAFASPTVKIAAMALGVQVYPAPATITVNGRTITVDLQNDSLTDIAAKINAASSNSASVETIGQGSAATYRLRISGTVAATADTGSQPILDILGLSKGVTDPVQQQVTTSNVLQDSGGGTATANTALLGLQIAGGTGAASGDTFTVAGTRPDGTSVNFTETVDNTRTVGDLLNDLSTAFSGSGRHVTASVVGGKIQLNDDAGGDSALAFSIAANNQSGGTLSFGATSTTAAGRLRQMAAGQDGKLIVNGVSLTRSTNVITDAIGGVTLNLQQAEQGTTIPLTVARDTTKAVQAVQAFAQAYNAVHSFVSSNTASGGALAFDTTARSAFESIRDTLLGDVVGLPAGNAYGNEALVGVTLDKSGALQVDSTALTNALNTNPSAVRALFATNGVMDASNFSYINSSSSTAPGNYGVQVTRAATTAAITGSTSNFVFAAGASPETLTIGDSASGNSGTLTLVNGDTPTTVAAKLNSLFGAHGIRLSATTVNGSLSVQSLDYGSAPSFTISYGSNDAAAQLGIAAGTVKNGQDVAGTFVSADGLTSYAATGAGQVLTGGSGTPVSGLTVMYTGSTASSSHINYAAGVGGLVAGLTNLLSRAGDGTAAVQATDLQTTIDQLTQQETDIQARLAQRKQALTAQFTAMETALAKIKSQGDWLTSQINTMSTVQSSAASLGALQSPTG